MKFALSLLFGLSVVFGPITEAQDKKEKTDPPAFDSFELTKIKRKIGAQPAYATDDPLFCLLVFGPEAKFKMWLILDGNHLFVDRNGNGDLIDPGERVTIPKEWYETGTRSFVVGDIADPVTKTTHRRLIVHGPRGDKKGTQITIRSAGKKVQTCYPEWSTRPRDAPIVHFDGPVTLKLDEPSQRTSEFGIGRAGILRRGQQAGISGYIGTPGLGEHSFAYYFAKDLLPNGLIVEFQFHAEGKGRLRSRATLKPDVVMMVGYFQVPAKAKLGTRDLKAYLPENKDIAGVPFAIPEVETRD